MTQCPAKHRTHANSRAHHVELICEASRAQGSGKNSKATRRLADQSARHGEHARQEAKRPARDGLRLCFGGPGDREAAPRGRQSRFGP